jgi:hypothetical protein
MYDAVLTHPPPLPGCDVICSPFGTVSNIRLVLSAWCCPSGECSAPGICTPDPTMSHRVTIVLRERNLLRATDRDCTEIRREVLPLKMPIAVWRPGAIGTFSTAQSSRPGLPSPV